MRIPAVLFLALGAVAAAFAAPAVSPDSVVANVNGKPLTAAEIDRILSGAPANMQAELRSNPKMFVKQYALVSYLARIGEEKGLAAKSPYKEQLVWTRDQVLLQAAISNHHSELVKQGVPKADLDAKMQEWMQGVRAASKAEIVDQNYFSADLTTAGKTAGDTVVAKINGKPITAEQIRVLLMGATSKVRDDFKKNRKEFMQQYAMMQQLVSIAEKEGIEKKDPYREQLAWVRMNVLSQATLNDHSDRISISPEDEQAFYKEHQNKYTHAKVKVIYIPFGSGDSVGKVIDGQKVLSEEQAKAKIEQVRKEAVTPGADFVALVKKYSEDETSKAKDGDFGTIRKSDKLPEHVRAAIFGLKPGEVSQPVRQPNGFYLFQVEEIGVQPVEEVRQSLRREAKAEKFAKWVSSLQGSMKVSFLNEEYFAGSKEKK